MSKRLTVDSLLETFPYALSLDEDMIALARVVGKELSQLYESCDLLTMYSRIDELPESLLDILAYDFKVDWYLYDASITAKRRQIKSLFDVHKHLGTKAAMERALSDVCPGTVVEPWYEYGGRPYHFRVVYDVSHQMIPISNEIIERMIRIFKSARDFLESGQFAIKSGAVILVSVVGGHIAYTARICGTYPSPAMQGQIAHETVEVTPRAGSASYDVPRSGDNVAGTYPRQAVQGQIAREAIEVSAADGNADFDVPEAGTLPYPAIQGETFRQIIEIDAEDDFASEIVPRVGELQSGTYPRISSQGEMQDGNINLGAQGSYAAYSARACGETPAPL